MYAGIPNKVYTTTVISMKQTAHDSDALSVLLWRSELRKLAFPARSVVVAMSDGDMDVDKARI